MIFLLPEGRRLLTFLLIPIFWWWILSAFVHLDMSWFYFHFYCLLTWGSFLGSARTPSMHPPRTFSEAVTGQHGVHTVCAHPSGTTVLAWCPGPWEPVTLYFIQVLSRYRALVHLLGCPQYHSIVTLSMMFSATIVLTFVSLHKRGPFLQLLLRFSLFHGFEPFHFNVTWCSFFHVSYTWDPLSSFDLWVYSFQQRWGFFSTYFFK